MDKFRSKKVALFAGGIIALTMVGGGLASALSSTSANSVAETSIVQAV